MSNILKEHHVWAKRFLDEDSDWEPAMIVAESYITARIQRLRRAKEKKDQFKYKSVQKTLETRSLPIQDDKRNYGEKSQAIIHKPVLCQMCRYTIFMTLSIESCI